FLLILLFATVNAFLEEVLWRGILLSKMISITSRPIGLIVSSFAFGINTTMFGFSLVICMMYVFLGLILGFVTVRTKSIFPAIFIHCVITIIIFINGIMTLPI
ncbi:CPBP family intramembrane glutamic endopeptidase, partial [Neobacillus drentensis]|uniref:CPBP family intramembrane glutamic endopeptidase n=1 Tax=Neobacillus drentensis TaxID=220684 RepID=UPI003002927E